VPFSNTDPLAITPRIVVGSCLAEDSFTRAKRPWLALSSPQVSALSVELVASRLPALDLSPVCCTGALLDSEAQHSNHYYS
jgi:hypothetical protein